MCLRGLVQLLLRHVIGGVVHRVFGHMAQTVVVVGGDLPVVQDFGMKLSGFVITVEEPAQVPRPHQKEHRTESSR